MKKVLTLSIMLLVLSFALSSVYAEDLTPELCKEKVMAAAALLKAEGSAALDKIKAEDGEFRFGGGKGYVWVHNLDGLMVMHPIKPTLDGKSVLDMRDPNGTYLFAAMNEVAEDSGAGWVPYAWPKPGDTDTSPKISYVVLAEHADDSYVAGAGMYDVTAADITAKFPDDAIYED